MTIPELLGAVGTLAGVGGIITFGVFAYRSRGEAIAAKNETAEAQRHELAAERRADTCERGRLDAEMTAVAKTKELIVTTAELERVRGELAAERAAKGKLYAKLAALGAPVGDVVVDDAMDGLYEDPNRGKAR